MNFSLWWWDKNEQSGPLWLVNSAIYNTNIRRVPDSRLGWVFGSPLIKVFKCVGDDLLESRKFDESVQLLQVYFGCRQICIFFNWQMYTKRDGKLSLLCRQPSLTYQQSKFSNSLLARRESREMSSFHQQDRFKPKSQQPCARDCVSFPIGIANFRPAAARLAEPSNSSSIKPISDVGNGRKHMRPPPPLLPVNRQTKPFLFLVFVWGAWPAFLYWLLAYILDVTWGVLRQKH